jgi:peptidoglycan/xylan/chitin deacetylase (PgdA/CDA1 family)
MRAYVLTYHSGNVTGSDYAHNDLIALAEDLEQLHSLAIPIVPLSTVVDALLGGGHSQFPERAVAITLDDGLDFDFVDLVHPLHGPQESAYSVLRRFAQRHAESVHATTFVIASPEARVQIADREMLGYRWINDHWWAAAAASGFFDIGNHSWDHVSPSVSPVRLKSGKTGSFSHVETFEDADLQVRAAHDFIVAKAPGAGAGLFAYPYGTGNAYLVEEYFPRHGPRQGTVAAFAGTPEPVHRGSDRWQLPRYVCGKHWRSAGDLAGMLRG